MTCDNIEHEKITKSKEGYYLNKLGEKYVIVHQIDRGCNIDKFLTLHIASLDNIDDVNVFYNLTLNNNNLKNKIMYDAFTINHNYFNDGILKNYWNNSLGCGEPCFTWSWNLLIKSLPEKSKILEIGVYCGRVICLIELLSNLYKKNIAIFGISPLTNANDSVSTYESKDYLQIIKDTYNNNKLSFDNTTLLKGYSEDFNIINQASKHMFDIIYIDGNHDYTNVCLDIVNYAPLIKINGYLVMDDACTELERYGDNSFRGHKDVGKAIEDSLWNSSIES